MNNSLTQWYFFESQKAWFLTKKFSAGQDDWFKVAKEKASMSAYGFKKEFFRFYVDIR